MELYEFNSGWRLGLIVLLYEGNGRPQNRTPAYRHFSSPTSQTRFGDFSSVAVDPQVPGGTCAVVAQQYFSAGGTWNTRLARVARCQPPVLVPDVWNDHLAEAGQVLAAAGLTVG